MKLFALATSRWGPMLIMLLCRLLPRHLAYRLGDWLVSVASRNRNIPLFQALRANLAALSGLPEQHPYVSQRLQHLLANMVRSYVDFFRAVQEGSDAVAGMCAISPELDQTINQTISDGRGLILAGIHTCSLDILLLRLAKIPVDVQVLTQAGPTGSSCILNDIRERHGLEVTPISTQALRQAIRRLRSGGIVVIAADIPIDGEDQRLLFGMPASLGSGYARLAACTGARIMVGACYRLGDGVYQADGTLLTSPQETGDRQRDVTRHVKQALAAMEQLIQHRPNQWFMPWPVWPRALQAST